MKQLLRLANLIDAVTGAIGRAMWWLSLFMVIVGVYNVLTRYFYGPLERLVGRELIARMTGNFYLEVQALSFDLIFLLGAAFVWRLDAHVRVDIVFVTLSAKAKALVDVIGTWLLAVPFFVLGIVYSLPYVRRSWQALEVSPNPGGLPRYPIKALIVVAFALLLLQAVSLTIRNVAFLLGRRDSGSVHDRPAVVTTVTGDADSTGKVSL